MDTEAASAMDGVWQTIWTSNMAGWRPGCDSAGLARQGDAAIDYIMVEGEVGDPSLCSQHGTSECAITISRTHGARR